MAAGVRLFEQLWFQVLVGMAAGILLGVLAPDAGAAMKPLGDAFIALIRMMIGAGDLRARWSTASPA